MLEDFIFISSISLEVFVLIYFICHIVNYLKHSKEIVDPYTKWTLILLSLSFLFQISRLPILAMKINYEETSDQNYRQWYETNQPIMRQVETAMIFFHGNVQKSAIFLNILRWELLTITLYNKSIKTKTIVAKFVVAIIAVLMIFSAYVLLYVPPQKGELNILNFILGNLINSYIVNAAIIIAYLYEYSKLKSHYLFIQLKYT